MAGCDKHLFYSVILFCLKTLDTDTAPMLRAVFRYPVLNHFDWLMGGVFGFLQGVLLCFVVFTTLPLVESVIPLEAFRLLVDQSQLAQFFKNGNLIISIMNRKL